MLKSLFRELTGASLKDSDPCPSLAPFRDKCHVVVVFEGSNDDRPLRQEEALVPYDRTLADHDIAVLRVAGGGVFQLFENPFGKTKWLLENATGTIASGRFAPAAGGRSIATTSSLRFMVAPQL